MYANNIDIFCINIFADVETSIEDSSVFDNSDSDILDTETDIIEEEKEEIESGTLSTYDYQHYVTNRLDIISYSLLFLVAMFFMFIVFLFMRRRS